MLDEIKDDKPVEHTENELNTPETEQSVPTEAQSAEDKEKVNAEAEAETEQAISEDSKEEDKAVEEHKEQEIPLFDYAKMGLDELVGALQNLLHNYPIQKIKDQFETIKNDFNKKFSKYLAEKKEAFVKAGGEESSFHITSKAKNDFNTLVREFKQKRQQYYNDLEKQQQQNLKKRQELIEQLKELIDQADPATMYKDFRALQDEWRAVGQIPHNKYNDVWRTYHHHVERFYDLLHLNKDFRELDFKHNLEEKTKLVEKAEALAQHEDVQHAFKELQILHRLWKEDIGPVAREFRDEVWNRFSEATKKIHQKRHDFQHELEEKFKGNADLKEVVIEKIKQINLDGVVSHKAWQDKIKEVEKLRDEFFAIGKVPRSRNEEIWKKFKEATKGFNKAKNSFYKSVKKDQLDNLRKKINLVEQAESLKDSDDWNAATEVFKKIQAEWKHIGHVPRKDSDKIWKRFKDACNHYFDRLHKRQDDANKGLVEVFNQKKALLDQFKSKIEEEANLTIELVNEKVNEWKTLGAVPEKMRHIEGKFSKALDVAYKKLNISKKDAAIMKFKTIVDGFVTNGDARKLHQEQLFVRRKIDEITKEIKQLENNISFISNASEDNPLIKNVYKNIDKHKAELEIWKEKLQYLSQIEI